MLDYLSLKDQARRNRRDTVLVLAAIASLMSLAGWLLAGGLGVVAALAGTALALAISPGNSVALLRTLYRARPLPFQAAPGLWRIHMELCRRAELETVPPLLIIPSASVIALSTGWGRHCAIALSEGALGRFSPEEIAAILAHEIAHIRAGDLKLLRLADTAGHLTHALAAATLILLAVLLPDMLAGEAAPNLPAIVLLALSPIGCDLLRLRLSRTREFAADSEAARLCGSPLGLISALGRLERRHGSFAPTGWWQLIRTHPSTSERIARLQDLAPPLPHAPQRLVFGPGLRYAPTPSAQARYAWAAHPRRRHMW
ncbi:putative Zn-dependent protease with chaperone function [Magnetospirillum sp. XM-1]|uniref:M48 family metalloprotease n=1 Tax=Magnetospirillum sp. XM-1 TaxID=1663591 RepID=UPI00073DF591|nr:M48 family metalloprotease [Magnetospirillum sp. XM-1]CUW39833.1 putative Zn-dependent protease with chaperone function [Magnetospirillum sp. XM-1]